MKIVVSCPLLVDVSFSGGILTMIIVDGKKKVITP
jgi:hypothetical protein